MLKKNRLATPLSKFPKDFRGMAIRCSHTLGKCKRKYVLKSRHSGIRRANLNSGKKSEYIKSVIGGSRNLVNIFNSIRFLSIRNVRSKFNSLFQQKLFVQTEPTIQSCFGSTRACIRLFDLLPKWILTSLVCSRRMIPVCCKFL